MSEDSPIVSLELVSRPENLTLVRGMLGGVGELLSVDPELLDDLKTAVSEACNNVVLHAYQGDPGPLAINLYVSPSAIGVSVRDQGRGMSYVAPVDDRLHGIGVPVIRALAEQAEFRQGANGGTEVWMSFAGERDGKVLFERPSVAVPDDGWTRRLAGEAIVSLSPVTLLTGVLGRLSRALAASARFSLDRFSDLYLVTDAIAALAQRMACGERIGFSLNAESRRLEMIVGPFREGARKLLQTDDPVIGVRSPLALLSDELEMQADEGLERLRVAMIDRR